MLLAGLVSTNQIFFALSLQPESLFRMFVPRSTTSSGWMDHIVRDPHGLWINFTRHGGQRNISHARRQLVNELCLTNSLEGACRTITGFAFPYLSNRLYSISLFTFHMEKWDAEKAMREFTTFARQEHIFSQAQLSRLQDVRSERNMFPPSAVSQYFSQAFGFTPEEERFVDINYDDVMSVFMLIGGLWTHIFIKIFSKNIHVEGKCIVMDYAQNVRINQLMEPRLLEGASMALYGVSQDIFRKSVNQKIWRKIKEKGGVESVCNYFTLPDVKEWTSPDAYAPDTFF